MKLKALGAVLFAAASVHAAQITSDTTWRKADLDAIAEGEGIEIGAGAVLTVTLGSGEDERISGVISGAGALRVAGTGGTLRLAGANTYTGGTTLSDGDGGGTLQAKKSLVYAENVAAFGTGTITVDSAGVRLHYNAGGVFANELVANASFVLFLDQPDLHVGGRVTVASGETLYYKVGQWWNLFFDKEVCAAGAGVFASEGSGSSVNFQKKVTAGRFGGCNSFIIDGNYNHARCNVYLHASANEIATFVPTGLSSCHFLFVAADGLNANTVISYPATTANYRDGKGSFALDLNGKSQTVNRLVTDGCYSEYGITKQMVANEAITAPDDYCTASSAATLTMKATQDAFTWTRFAGQVSLVWDPQGDYTYSVSNRIHDTAGSITVNCGTMRVGGHTTWTNVPSLTVAADAAFVHDGYDAGAFAGLTSLAVGRNGRFSCLRDAAPFASGAVTAALRTGAKLAFPANATVTLKSVRIDGWPIATGTYTAANCSWVEGEGVSVIVQEMPTEVVWTKTDIELLEGGDLVLPAGCSLTLAVAADDSFTISNRITGAGALVLRGHDGTVRLTGANDYTGGTMLTDDDGLGSILNQRRLVIYGDTVSAFGTGAVTVSSAGVRLYYNASGTFPNDLVFTTSAVLYLNQDNLHVGGTVTVASGEALYFVATGDDRYQLYFDKPVHAAGASLFAEGGSRSTVTFSGKVTAARFGSHNSVKIDNAYNQARGFSKLAAEGNEIGEAVVSYLSAGGFRVACADALSTNSVIVYPAASTDYREKNGGYKFLLDGKSQTVNRLETVGSGALNASDDMLTSSAAATLTMKATQSAWTGTRFDGMTSLVWDPQGDYTFAVSNRIHGMSGSVTVRRGTMFAGGATTWANAKTLAVGADASFVLDTSEANALAGLEELSVATGGAFRVVSGATPFTGSQVVLHVAKGAVIELPADTEVDCGTVYYGGERLAIGDYTTATCPWIKGSGATLRVTTEKTPECAFWKEAVDGWWDDATRWIDGILPSTARTTEVATVGRDYTVGVRTATAFGPVRIGNAIGTATVDVRAAATLEAPHLFEIGEGGRVIVGEGGSLTGVSASSHTLAIERMVVRDGGELKIGNGGALSWPSARGRLSAYSGGRITLDGGTLSYAPAGNSTFQLTLFENGLFCTTSGVLEITDKFWGSTPMWLQKGRMDFAGDATLRMKTGTRRVRILSGGTVTFAGHSKLTSETRIDGWAFGTSQAVQQQISRVEFTEHASVGCEDATGDFAEQVSVGSPDYGNGVGSYGGSLLFHSDATNRLAQGVYIADRYGYGELEVTSGAVVVSRDGVQVASQYADSTDNCVSRGELRVSGGTLRVEATATDAGAFSGLLVGAGQRGSLDGEGNPRANSYDGTFRLSGGEVTLESAAAGFGQTIVGVGTATGLVVQTGGAYRDTGTSHGQAAAIGMGGGVGTWRMSGGTATFAGDLYVGGVTTNALGRHYVWSGTDYYAGGDRHDATGCLEITGGRMDVGGDLVLSQDGTGTLALGLDGRLAVAGRLDARAGSKLVVDARGFTGEKNLKIASFAGGVATSFSPESVTLIKDDTEAARNVQLLVTSHAIRVGHPVGMMCIVR